MAEDNAVVSAKEKKHSVKDLGAAGTEFLRNHKHIYTRHRKKILVFFLCIVAVILWVLVFNLRKYDDFDVKETYERVDSAETSYQPKAFSSAIQSPCTFNTCSTMSRPQP